MAFARARRGWVRRVTIAQPKNRLYFGDNLTILRGWFTDASVDLIYLVPPFNSNRSYNLLFKEKSGEGSAAQSEAFGDTWSWAKQANQKEEHPLWTNWCNG